MGKKTEFQKLSIYDTPKQSPGFLLWHISTAWRSSIEAVLKAMGLTHPQFVVLATLGWLTQHGERVTQAAVGKMAGLDPNTTSQILKGLEKKDLAERVKSFDGRVKSPLLTSKGKKILNQALPAVEQADSKFFSQLSLKEMNALIALFVKLGDRDKE